MARSRAALSFDGQSAHFAAGLEVLQGRVAHRHRPGVADAGLHRPAETGDEHQQLSGDGAQGEPAAENHGEFLDSLGSEGLSVGGGDLENHLGLIRGHDRQVGTGNAP